MAVGYPLTVAGAAIDLGKIAPARYSLLTPSLGHLVREIILA